VLEEIVKNAWHIPILMVMILIYGFLLNRVFFRPVQQVLDERKRRVREAGDLSGQSRDALKSKYQEYELAILEAHRKATHIKEQARNEAYDYRNKVLAEVKAEADGELRKAEEALSSNSAEVRKELKAVAPELARQVAAKILGREVAV
jgi:F-type H+-transporting ATPase subunit b